ncbi:MAG TPA: ATP-binding protein [Candidatus Acidoferrales bacterium]|nr:ATP-binding protein [Candidatus Acidoferrales bacterium]
MRALKRIRVFPTRLDDSFESLLAQFSATTLELSPSLGTSEFAKRLTSRAAEMLGARGAALALTEGFEWRIAGLHGPAGRWDDVIEAALAAALAEQANAPSAVLRTGAASALLGDDMAVALGWDDIVLVPLTGIGGELQGVLCIVDLPRELSTIERQLLEALAGHASVAFENVRLFSKIEQSRKQWVQDFDAIPDWIVVHDPECHVLRLNRALANALGLSPAAVVGREIGKLNLLGGPVQGRLCPFCRNSESAAEEHVHTHAERTYLISTSRITGARAADRRTIHVLKDITDRREAERRFRRERDFNRNILNNTQSMILVLDTAGLISYANRRCFEAGYGEGDLLGQPLADLVPIKSRAVLAEAFASALQGAAPNFDIQLQRSRGVMGQFSVSLSPMRDEQGQINSIVVVMTDVTDAADLQAKLMHTEKMAALGQLVSGVAHEVNNPLAAIVGFTDLLLENPQVPPSAKEELKVILQESERTRRIVQNLLSFARQMPARRELVHVNLVLRQTLTLRAYDFSNHGIELTENCGENLPPVMGDPHQLQQVFLNIMNNAYDAVRESRRGGQIEVRTALRDGRIEISFRDNGPGISQPDRIFDPFFTTKEVGKGTGLGLSICYGIVRAHRGEIAARNNADGHGCTFVVRLPVAAKSVATLPAEVA